MNNLFCKIKEYEKNGPRDMHMLAGQCRLGMSIPSYMIRVEWRGVNVGVITNIFIFLSPQGVNQYSALEHHTPRICAPKCVLP